MVQYMMSEPFEPNLHCNMSACVCYLWVSFVINVSCGLLLSKGYLIYYNNTGVWEEVFFICCELLIDASQLQWLLINDKVILILKRKSLTKIKTLTWPLGLIFEMIHIWSICLFVEVRQWRPLIFVFLDLNQDNTDPGHKLYLEKLIIVNFI